MGLVFLLCFFWSLFCNHQEIGKRKENPQVVLVFALFFNLLNPDVVNVFRENKITFIDLFLWARFCTVFYTEDDG